MKTIRNVLKNHGLGCRVDYGCGKGCENCDGLKKAEAEIKELVMRYVYEKDYVGEWGLAQKEIANNIITNLFPEREKEVKQWQWQKSNQNNDEKGTK